MTGERVVSEEVAAKILALPDDSRVPKEKVRIIGYTLYIIMPTLQLPDETTEGQE